MNKNKFCGSPAISTCQNTDVHTSNLHIVLEAKMTSIKSQQISQLLHFYMFRYMT